MIYVCSDIHGEYSAYLDFVNSILTNNDTLYVIGDVLDRGANAIDLIQDIMRRQNVVMLKGNHEKILADTLEELCGAISEREICSIINDSLAIDKIGQRETLFDFAKLNKSGQRDIIDFINGLPLYEELEVNGQNYLLVHGGLPDFSDIPVEWYEENDLLFGPHDYDITHYEDTIVIVGHVPTRFIHGATPDKILIRNDTIAIDCGCGFGGQLGILCLDTDEEFYF